MTTKNENSINCNSSQNETKGRQNSDRNTVKVDQHFTFIYFNQLLIILILMFF